MFKNTFKAVKFCHITSEYKKSLKELTEENILIFNTPEELREF